MMGYMHFGVEMEKVETNAPTINLLDRRIKRKGWPPSIKKTEQKVGAFQRTTGCWMIVLKTKGLDYACQIYRLGNYI